jgi:transcription initiation factor IIF auxiliary subunit
LHKNPKLRIGATDKNEIKRHPFFRGLDWTKLTNKEIDPPIHLQMEEDDDNEELQYLKAMEKVKFKDEDYKTENKTLNRVKQFTFIGGGGAGAN